MEYILAYDDDNYRPTPAPTVAGDVCVEWQRLRVRPYVIVNNKFYTKSILSELNVCVACRKCCRTRVRSVNCGVYCVWNGAGSYTAGYNKYITVYTNCTVRMVWIMIIQWKLWL